MQLYRANSGAKLSSGRFLRSPKILRYIDFLFDFSTIMTASCRKKPVKNDVM